MFFRKTHLPGERKCVISEEIEKEDEHEKEREDDDPELEVKFNRTQVQNIVGPGSVTLYISGKVNGAAFMGNDTIRVIEKQEKDDEKNEDYDKDNKSKSKGGKS